MQQVKKGDTINVHYHGKLNDGTTFDSSEGRAPLEFTVGNGQVIQGFDEAVLDMKVGDKKTVNIPSAEAYGERNEDMMVTVPRSDFPTDMTPEVGMDLQMSDDQGHTFNVVITELRDNEIILDANHPLAGKDLNFDLELVSIA